MAKMSFKKNINIGRVVSKVVITLLALWIGGELLTAIGNVMNGSTSAFYTGLDIIGWTVTNGQITNTTTTDGVLGIVGLVGVASVVMEFVNFSL